MPRKHDDDSSESSDEDSREDESGDSGSVSEDSYSEDEATGNDGLGEKNSGLGGGGGFADALQKILKKQVPSDSPGGSILSKRKTPNMRLIEKEMKEARERKRAKETKKDKDMIGLVIPSYKTLNYERQLRRVATRGVVSLFNAVKTAQTSKDNVDSLSSGGGRGDKGISKDKFFDMLADGAASGSGAANSSSTKSRQQKDSSTTIGSGKDGKTGGKGADWLDDDFMMGAKMRNWDKDSDDSDNNGAAIEAEVE